ncbi:hypothetical protein ACH4XT_11880 [Streptomyces avidinii]|nr:hypothetical protein OG592_23875 [Streptomyces avidinii]
MIIGISGPHTAPPDAWGTRRAVDILHTVSGLRVQGFAAFAALFS